MNVVVCLAAPSLALVLTTTSCCLPRYIPGAVGCPRTARSLSSIIIPVLTTAPPMAAVAPPGTSNPSPMQTDSQDIPQLSWEGDKMSVSPNIRVSSTDPPLRFNIYIHDYCTKRGFTSTARELMHEADISSDATPPINARQGLLFECVKSPDISACFFDRIS